MTLNEIQKKLGWSNVALARFLGVTTKTVYNWKHDSEIKYGHKAAIEKLKSQLPAKLQIKLLYPDSKMPTRAHEWDAGLDLYARFVEDHVEYPGYLISTGIAAHIPEGYVGLIFPRSSIRNTDLILKNSVGVIDSGYTGEIMFTFQRLKKHDRNYHHGDKIGQLVILPLPKIEIEVVDKLPETERGDNGHGSTGN